MDPYRRLAAELIYGATLDYHSYWNTGLRREQVLRATRNKRTKRDRWNMEQIVVNRLKARASLAERWMWGSHAPMPFELCCHALGWDEQALASRIMADRTGDNLEVN